MQNSICEDLVSDWLESTKNIGSAKLAAICIFYTQSEGILSSEREDLKSEIGCHWPLVTPIHSVRSSVFVWKLAGRSKSSHYQEGCVHLYQMSLVVFSLMKHFMKY